MTHWKLTLAYDGTPFRGWQVQPGLPTIQGLLADAIHCTVGERVLPQGSGRTDAGVHALGQVASFTLAAPIPATNFHNALNRCLPPSIRICAAEIVPPDFHARHSALRKTYEYRIFPLKPAPHPIPPHHPSPNPTDKDRVLHPSQPHRDGWDVAPSTPTDAICPPILAPYVWPCPWPLDLAALTQAASHVLGTHDFTTFAAADPDLTTRRMSEATSPELAPLSLQGNPRPAALQDSPSPPAHPGNPRLQPWASQPAVLGGALAPGVCSAPEPPPARTNLRTITESTWLAQDALLIYRVTATGFLHHMVRNLVGTFVQCGAHRLSPDSIPNLIAARNRSAAGPTAPPTGLFLVSVEYPDL